MTTLEMTTGNQPVVTAFRVEDKLREHADAIRRACDRTIDGIVEIGHHLTEARKIARRCWLSWLGTEFGWSGNRALDFMNIYKMSKKYKFADLANLNIPFSNLSLLASPGTPEEVRDEVLKQAEAGQSVTVFDIRVKIAAAKGRLNPHHKTDAPDYSEEGQLARIYDLEDQLQDAFFCISGKPNEDLHRYYCQKAAEIAQRLK
jgi:hypothetical protein